MLLLPLVLLGYFLVPALVRLTPWHERVILVLGDGERLVLHDLDDSRGLVSLVRRGLELHG